MFRAHRAHHQERQIVSIQPLVTVILCWWPSCVQVRSLRCHAQLHLQTARVRIVGPTGLSKLARCVLDSGSQTSFVSTSIIDTLKLDVIDQQNLVVSAFESSSVTSRSRRLVRLDLRGIWTNCTTITAFESAYEFLAQPTVPHDVNMMTHIPKLQLADPCKQEDLPI
jgi:hypothetical protein